MTELEDSDYYLTLSSPTETEIKIEKSRFIAQCFPIETAEEALTKLEEVRLQHYNANHNCWAYSIGGDGLKFRFSDDGEPNNSAGKPIMFSIKKSELSDIIVVVTRYFGGKKLGKGGLVKAYGEAADLALEIAERKKILLTEAIEVFCTYEDISPIKRLLTEFATSFDEEYTDSIRIVAHIPLSMVGAFTFRVVDDTAARAGWRKLFQ